MQTENAMNPEIERLRIDYQLAARAYCAALEEENRSRPRKRLDKNCLSYWFPILKSTGLPVPRTEILSTNVELLRLCDGQKPEGYDQFIADLTAMCIGIGTPVFLRTGQTSGKHYWNETCHVTDLAKLPQHVYQLVEFSATADMCGLDDDVWVAREFIPMYSLFEWFPGKMPINRERRYFIRDGKVVCHHAYWPKDAFGDFDEKPAPKSILKKLGILNSETASEVAELTAMADTAAKAFDGYWSLDFSQDAKGKWWAIDMAIGERSYHWPGCTAH